jgi:ribonuclease-3
LNGDDDALSELMQRLGHRFASLALLLEALTHPSAVGRERPRSYERLEFLGDRVLALVLAEMLYDRFPNEAEGPLAKRLSVLAQRETLTEIALELDLGRDLILAISEDMSGGRANPTALGDALEALLGAVYLDGGMAPAAALVRRLWEPLLELAPEPPQDPKTGLQEWAQARGLPLPRYREVGRSGPPHEPLFTIEVSVVGHEPASAAGRSKRAAERAAAEQLLARVLGRQP